jgi:hypothetical protein
MRANAHVGKIVRTMRGRTPPGRSSMAELNPRSFAVGGAWHGIPMACHDATLFWLFEAEFNRPPASMNECLDAFSTPHNNPTGIVRDMLAFGQSLRRPGAGHTALTKGSVVVFVDNGQPGHCCVATGSHQIGGCNQVNWFTGAGAVNGDATHATSAFKWRGARHPLHIEGNVHRKWCGPVAVPRNAARAMVRKAVQG